MTYRILAVDDHPQTLDIVIITLQQHGYQAIGTHSPLQAIPLAEKERPHLILLDMSMPEMDGKDVCRQIRAHPELSTLPVIMFSAEAAQKLESFQAGADDFLVKPADPDELISRIEALLESSGAVESDVVDASKEEGKIGGEQATPFVDASLPKDHRLIAILGVRGGAGATTLATNLAYSAAGLGHSTTLIDLDLLQGHVARYLSRKVSGGIRALVHLPDDDLPQEMNRQLVPFNENLRLLMTTPDFVGASIAPSPKQIAIIMNAAKRSNRCVVVDLGHELTDNARAVLDGADTVIVCLRPERVSLAAARQMINHLKEILYPHTDLRALMFGVVGGMKLPKRAVEGFLNHRLLAIIPAQPKGMLNALNKGVTFAELYPDTQVTKAFRLLAQHLVETPKKVRS